MATPLGPSMAQYQLRNNYFRIKILLLLLLLLFFFFKMVQDIKIKKKIDKIRDMGHIGLRIKYSLLCIYQW